MDIAFRLRRPRLVGGSSFADQPRWVEPLAAGCSTLRLVTTNDNVEALAFYRRRGLRVVAVRADAMASARALKPSIPAVGANGVPIRDEIELELVLSR